MKALKKDITADPGDRQGPTSGEPIPITDVEFAQVRELLVDAVGCDSRTGPLTATPALV